MAKDAHFHWPPVLGDSGKLLRLLVETGRKHNNHNPTFGGSYLELQKQHRDFAKRFGHDSAIDTGTIAIAFVAHLIEEGVIENPFADGTYY